jgi:hypothetical protein
MLKKKDKGGGVAVLYQVERRANFSNSISRCPIIWHELHELRELRFKIKDLQRERRKTKRELHELLNIIKDLRANRAFILLGGRGSNVVDEVGAVGLGKNKVGAVGRGRKRRATGRHSRTPTYPVPTKF